MSCFLNYFGKKLEIDDFSARKMGSFTGVVDENNFADLREKKKISNFLEESFKYEKPVMLDIGANFGSYSYITLFNENLKVFAFDPVLEVYNSFIENIRLNSLKNIEVFNLGLSSKEGEAFLKVEKSLNIGKSRLSEKTEKDTRVVQIKTLDSFIDYFPSCDLIKIDVEGHEWEILKGAENLFNKFEPKYVQVEIWNKSTHKQKIIDWFSSKNYSYSKQHSDYIFRKNNFF